MSEEPPGLRPGPPGHCRGSEGRTAGAGEPGDPEGPFRTLFLTSSAPPLAPGSAPPSPFPNPGARRRCLSRVPPRTPDRLCNTRRANSYPRRISLLPGPHRNSHRSACPPRCARCARSLCSSRGLPLNPSTDFLPALRGPSAPAAWSPLRTGPAASWRLPRHPGGRGGISPAGSRRVPGGPRAAGKRDPGPVRSGAGAAGGAAAAPAGAGGGRAVGGAETPCPPSTVAERAAWGRGRNDRNPGPSLGSAVLSRPASPASGLHSGGGAGRVEGRAPGWAHPSARPPRATRPRCAPSPRSSSRPRPHRPLRADGQLGPLQPTPRVVPLLPALQKKVWFSSFSPLLFPRVRILCVDIRPQLESQRKSVF